MGGEGKIKGKICAFCTTSLAYDKPVRSTAPGLLLRFCKVVLEEDDDGQVSRRKRRGSGWTMPENWTICVECMPLVSETLGRREKVDRLEKKVRKLQVELLKELNGLLGEVDKLRGDLEKMEGIMGKGEVTKLRRKEEVTMTGDKGRLRRNLGQKRGDGDEEDDEVVGLRRNVEQVRRRFQVFGEAAGQRLLIDRNFEEDPPEKSGRRSVKRRKVSEEDQEEDANLRRCLEEVKAEPEPEEPCDNNEEGDFWDFLENLSEPGGDVEDDGGDVGKKEAISQKEDEEDDDDETESSEEEEEDSSDDDFIPEDKSKFTLLAKTQLPSTMKYFSIFRRNLITRIREQGSIATNKNLPSSPLTDPRRGYSLIYNSKLNCFYLNSTPILCLDTETCLQCTLCSYKTPPKNPKRRRTYPEDYIFEHILAKHLNSYQCSHCSSILTDYQSFKKHEAFHLALYSCDICGRPMTDPGTIKFHKWTHLNAEEKLDPGNQHMMPHHEKFKEKLNQKKFQCSTCGKAFSRRDLLEGHCQIHLPPGERERIICSQCGAQMWQTSYKIHLKYCGKREKGVVCPVCGDRVVNTKVLIKHINQKHPESRSYCCEVCGKGFKTKPLLRHHKEVHDEVGRYVCGGCGARFRQKKNLNKHEQSSCGGGRRGNEGGFKEGMGEGEEMQYF